MTFDEAMQEAARRADQAVTSTMRRYRKGDVTDEPEITGELMGQLVTRFEKKVAGGISWNGNIARNGKGKAAEENRTGADLLMHVRVDTPTMSYSKGVLVQAKRFEPDDLAGSTELGKLRGQCKNMLMITPAAFVFDYAKGSMRVGPATRFWGLRTAGSTSSALGPHTVSFSNCSGAR